MKLAVDDSVLDYYRARVAVLDDQPEAAARLIKSAIARARSDEAKRYYGDQLLDLSIAYGDPLKAYQDSAEPEYAFGYLAQRLSEFEIPDTLLALASAHVSRVPTSPEGYFYSGRALLLKERYEEAATALAKGLALTTSDPQREAFRSNLVAALYKAGKGLEAYQEVLPHRDTLEQLAGLYLGDQQAEPLLKLVAAARKDDPENGSLDSWEAEGKMLLKDYAGAAERLKTAMAKADGVARKRVLAAKLLDARLAGKVPAQGYAEVPDKDYAFSYLGEALVKDGDLSGLTAVIEAHRAKTPRDPRLLYYSGQAHMLAKDYSGRGERLCGRPRTVHRPCLGRPVPQQPSPARCQLGEALKAYQESDDKPLTYRLLGPLLIELNRADDLAALVKRIGAWPPRSRPSASGRRNRTGWPTTTRESSTCSAASATRSWPTATTRPRYEDRLVRSLLRLKKFDAAARAAKESTDRDGDPLFEAVVAIAAGDVDRAGPLVEQRAAGATGPATSMPTLTSPHVQEPGLPRAPEESSGDQLKNGKGSG